MRMTLSDVLTKNLRFNFRGIFSSPRSRQITYKGSENGQISGRIVSLFYQSFQALESQLTKSETLIMKNIAVIFTTLVAVFSLVGCSQQKFGTVDQTNHFGQSATYNNKVDILWVVDNSNSMAQHQQRIAQEVPGFINALKATGMDFHMGVTTMDCSSSGEDGRLVAAPGTPTYLTNSTPNMVSILQQRLQLGDNGSSVERALEATKNALTEPLASGFNAGFRRFDAADPTKGAVLAVIYLSNEDDQSGSAVPDPVAFFDAHAVKSQYVTDMPQWVVSFIGSTPDDPSCKTVPWTKEDGLAYIALANKSGGASSSICSGDFAAALKNVQGHILTMITEWHFPKTPVESTIRVFVNGNEIANDPVNGWTYVAARKVIQFHGTSIPGLGASIDVQYTQDFSQ